MELYENEYDEGLKYNIIKEIFRIEVVNNFTISDDVVNNKQTIHLHQPIMKNADETYNYLKYKSMYENHTFNKTNIELIVSDIDNETIIENVNPNNTPVYEKPKYCPFGFGYRRCAGENFVYYFIKNVMDTICEYKVEELKDGTSIDISVQRIEKNIFKLKKK